MAIVMLLEFINSWHAPCRTLTNSPLPTQPTSQFQIDQSIKQLGVRSQRTTHESLPAHPPLLKPTPITSKKNTYIPSPIPNCNPDSNPSNPNHNIIVVSNHHQYISSHGNRSHVPKPLAVLSPQKHALHRSHGARRNHFAAHHPQALFVSRATTKISLPTRSTARYPWHRRLSTPPAQFTGPDAQLPGMQLLERGAGVGACGYVCLASVKGG